MAEVSIVIPAYNTGAYLGECLSSIANQTFRDFEAIVIDDGSTDNSLSIALEFAKKDSRFFVIHQENMGLSGARNTGIQAHSCPWITFVDSDDVLGTSFLERLMSIAKDTNSEICCCGKKSFHKNIPHNFSHNIQNSTTILSGIEAIQNALYQKDCPDYSAWNKIFKSSLWETQTFPVGLFFEDFATIPDIFLKAEKISFVNEPLYFYRKRNTSILATSYSIEKACLLDIAEKMYTRFNDNKIVSGAAQSMLFSASCSILKRTPNTAEFKEYQQRAWTWILATRKKILLDSRTRARNKMASLLSFLPKPLFLKLLKKG